MGSCVVLGHCICFRDFVFCGFGLRHISGFERVQFTSFTSTGTYGCRFKVQGFNFRGGLPGFQP